MNKGFKRFLSAALSAVMVMSSITFAGISSVFAADTVTIYDCVGVQEAAYVEWAAVGGTSHYYVSYSKDGSNFTQIDDELIRKYPDRWRADLIGLSAGNYTVKVTCKDSSNNVIAESTSNATVVPHDRTGFTFSPKSAAYDNGGCGAYNADGTLKSDATVLYVTDKNFDSVSLTLTDKGGKSYTATGLADITKTMGNAAAKGHSNPPLAVRFLGTIGEGHTGLVKPSMLETKGKTDAKVNITFEGVGEDTIFDGLALRLNGVANCEIRNISFWNWHDDAVQLQGNPNSNHWLHNNDFFYGENHGGDQEKGDGSTDVKDDTKWTTYSYNHYWDSGKTSLCGMKGESGDNYISYHHNWFDHSDSRHPRIRTMFCHVYNNYYDGVSKYGVGAALNSSAFVEGNYFRNTKYPMLTSMQGSDMNGGKGTFSSENGGVIKAYNNYVEGGRGVVYYDPVAAPVEYDAYLASSRDEAVPSSVKAKQGGKTFNNSNVDSYVLSIPVESPEVAKDKCIKYAGRVGKDFNWVFNNSVDDTDYNINAALASAVQSYVKNTADDFVSMGGASDGSGPVPTESTTELTTEGTTEAITEVTTQSTPVQIGEAQTSAAASGISVTFNAATNTWDLKDTSGTDSADITIPFVEQSSGKIVVSGTVKPGTTASKWAFIQIKGKNSSGVAGEIFGFGGGAAKTDLSVRLNGSATWNKIGAFGAKDYKYTIIFDLNNKTVDATIDGIKYTSSVDVSSISSISSTTSKKQSRNVSLSVPYVGVLDGGQPAPETTTKEGGTEVTTKEVPTETTTLAKPSADGEVRPTISGNSMIYNFSGNGGKLVSVTKADRAADSAYSDFKTTSVTGTDAENYVLLNANGAELNDYSASAPTLLVIPFSQSSGKVTISGEVTPSNTDQPKKGVGSKWKLVDFGVIAVTTDSAKNLTLASNNETPAATTVGALVAGQKVTYSVTLDLDAKTASATITNGATSQNFTNVAFGANPFTDIKFSTNGKGTRTSNSDRRLLVGNVTITSDNIADWVTVGAGDAKTSVRYKGNDYYVVSVVTSDEAAAGTKLSQLTAKASEVNSTDTIYSGVVIDGKTYTAADFGGTASDYVFATLVTNNNATAADTVLGNVRTVTSSVQ